MSRKTGLNVAEPKVKKMRKNFDPKILGRERAEVDGLVMYDRDPEPWPTYTPRTFWAIP